ncbi:Lipocalin, partial [Corvus brachyrhynchos]
MQATLLGILGLALLGTLHAQDSIPVQADFQQDKLTGRWYSIGLASNSNWFKEKRHLMKMCTTIISATADGNLEVTSTYPKLDKCHKFELLFQQSGQAGHYVGLSGHLWGPLGAQEKRDLHVMDTDYSHYAVLHEAQHSETEPSTALQLLTREQDVSPQLLQKFMELIPTMGLTEDMLAILPKSGEWPEGTG